MDILIPDSWLREYLTTQATPKQLQQALSLSGPSIERLNQTGNESIYNIEVTTNRVDCMSVIGIAREAAAILPRFSHHTKLLTDPFSTKIEFKISTKVNYLKTKIDPNLCPYFACILIKNVQVSPSPDWLTKKLALVGIRPINNLVDITNLLMYELGQPSHVFDYDKIANLTLTLRESKKGESVTTLDSKNHTLPGHDIVIEDGSGELIDLCGIMGGLNSSVTENTKNVLLFVQTYEPVHIRKTSMALSQRTHAAVLFEKGLVGKSVLPTMQKAINLIKQLAQGVCSDEALVLDNETLPQLSLKLEAPLSTLINKQLGTSLSLKEIKDILTSLNFEVQSEHEVIIPWYRSGDIQIPQDLVEEVARIYGYHNLDSYLMTGALPPPAPNKDFYWIEKLKYFLKHLGYTEVYTYSLVSNDPHGLKLKNPLSQDYSKLRTSIIPSHISVISENVGRVEQINIFEIANVYIPSAKSLPIETQTLAISTTNTNFLNFKGVIESISQEFGVSFPIDIVKHNNPSVLTLEINLNQILQRATNLKSYSPISKFSPIIEDINISLTDSYQNLVTKIMGISELIKKVELIDLYSNKLTLRLTFHSDSRQLNSQELSDVRAKILQTFN